MKIKNVAIISVSFLVLAFVGSVCWGFFFVPLPELIERTVKSYKFACSLKIFCEFLPGIAATCVLLGFSFEFGKNYQGSLTRFSPAMFSRFKSVLLTGVAFAFLLTIFSEIVLPAVNKNTKTYEEMPKLQKEYKNFAKTLYQNGRFELSHEFARMAAEINPLDKEASDLMDEAEIAIRQLEMSDGNRTNLDMAEILSSAETELNSFAFEQNQFSIEQNPLSADQNLFAANQNRFSESQNLFSTNQNQFSGNQNQFSENQNSLAENKNPPSESYRLLLTSRKCLENEDWFGAHFYAQEALSITNQKDVNYNNIRQIAAEAWNKISEARFSGTTEEQRIFAKKLEGYTALYEHDNLHAYYVFKSLSETSKSLSLDPDIVRYLSVAEERLENQYFFTDETVSLQNFENANNVYFKILHKDKTTDIYFIKGITSAGSNESLVQYLRGLCIFTLDRNGNYVSGSYTTYAKMKEISTSYFDDEAKKSLEIEEDIFTVPYIILNSVDRLKEGVMNKPAAQKGEPKFTESGYIILPINYSDFNLLKEASAGIDSMSISSIFLFSRIAEKYGYATELYVLSILNRLLYPLFILICSIALGIAAWHGRLPPNSVFKFKWIIVFPIFIFLDYMLYKSFMLFFKFINFTIMGIVGLKFAIPISTTVFVILLVIVSLIFVACRNSMTLQKN